MRARVLEYNLQSRGACLAKPRTTLNTPPPLGQHCENMNPPVPAYESAMKPCTMVIAVNIILLTYSKLAASSPLPAEILLVSGVTTALSA